jgi:hypothetical protein
VLKGLGKAADSAAPRANPLIKTTEPNSNIPLPTKDFHREIERFM